MNMFVRSHRLLPALGLLFATSASAYIPPTSYIVQKMAKARQGTGAVWVKSKVAAMVEGQVTDVHFFDITVFEPRTQVLLALAVDETNRVLFAKRTLLGVSQDDKTAASAPSGPLAAFVIYGESPQDLVNAALKAGIPVHQEPEPTEPFRFTLEAEGSNAAATGAAEGATGPDPLQFLDRMPKPLIEDTGVRRWKDTIAWVLARDSRRNSTSPPQIWVEKDSFLPLRVLEGGAEVQFERFRYVKSHAFPGITTVVEGGDAVLSAELVKVVTEPELKDRPRVNREGFTEAGQEITGRLRSLIEKYYAVLR
ncbi:MAG: hypothetical protein IT285_14610 [Bdellovibrionales bacterium]|nr:hypothetical protein [Bdellovibrionales bacterium]